MTRADVLFMNNKFNFLFVLEDLIIKRELFNKAIDLDPKLFVAKWHLARTFLIVGQYKKSMEILET